MTVYPHDYYSNDILEMQIDTFLDANQLHCKNSRTVIVLKDLIVSHVAPILINKCRILPAGALYE